MVFQLLLKAKDQYLTKTGTDQTYEMFLKTHAEFEKQITMLEVQPTKDRLYGRPYRDENKK